MEEDEDEIFDMEMEENLKDSFAESDDDSDNNNDDDRDESDHESMLITIDVKLMIQKLDSLLCLVMNYISDIYKKATSCGDFEKLFDVFDGLLQGFNRVILPTHKIRSTQFIIFYTCSLVPDIFCQDFLGLLISHLISTANSSISRISAASYLGSFISRAKFIDLESIRRCLLLLNQQCQSYLDNHESSIRGQLEVRAT